MLEILKVVQPSFVWDIYISKYLFILVVWFTAVKFCPGFFDTHLHSNQQLGDGQQVLRNLYSELAVDYLNSGTYMGETGRG